MISPTGKRLPDWTLCVKEGEEKWQSIGAAWETEKGHLFLKLDDGVQLRQDERRAYMMFPYRPKPTQPSRYMARKATPRPAVGAPIETMAPAESVQDYMDRKRAERQKGASPPQPSLHPGPQRPTPEIAAESQGETDAPCPGPDAPDWL